MVRTGPIVCCECRLPVAVNALVAKCGYADQARPCCASCYELSRYLQNRFTMLPMPSPPPKWVDDWRVEADAAERGES